MKRISKVWMAGLLLVLACSCIGCAGGGTTGTDGGGAAVRTVEVEGAVTLSSEQPAANYQIAVGETGDAALTDAQGRFLLKTALAGQEATLVITGSDFGSSLKVSDLPTGDARVSVRLNLDQTENLIEIVSITVSSLDPDEQDGEGSSSQSNSSAGSAGGGSGARGSIFQGHVKFLSGEPVKGAKVSLPALNGTDVTDGKGTFLIKTAPAGGDLLLQITYGRIHGQALLRDVPAEPVRVEMVVVLKIRPGDVSINSGPPRRVGLRIQSLQLVR